MSDMHNIHEPKDPFSEYFRLRLADHPTPPDELCWEEIEARMQKRRGLTPVWMVLAVAASLLVAVFTVSHLLTKDEQVVQDAITQAVATEESEESEEVEEVEGTTPAKGIQSMAVAEKKPAEEEIKRVEPLIDATNRVEPDRTVALAEATVSEGLKEDALVEKARAIEASVEISEQEALADAQKMDAQEADKPDVDAPTTAVPPEEKKQPVSRYDQLIASTTDYQRPAKKREGWQLSAEFGSGGGLLALLDLQQNDLVNAPDHNVSDPDYGDNEGEGNGNQNGEGNHNGENGGNGSTYSNGWNHTGNHPDKTTSLRNGTTDDNTLRNGISKEDISDMHHAVPISFGITVRKKLNKTLGVETGLVYTFLSTDLEMKGMHYRDATLKLHYIGVPMNLIVNMWDNGSWNVYASGGGMVEKGLQSIYKCYSYQSPGIHSKEKNSISGLQWSLSGGLGVSYRIYRGMNIFVEPGFSYYFDCNQPISKRTEDPFNFNLRLGVRYDF